MKFLKKWLLIMDQKNFRDLKRNIIIVDRNYLFQTYLKNLVESRNHMALVVDEYGSVSGLVTMEDVIETLLGSRNYG